MFQKYNLHGVNVWLDKENLDETGNAPLAQPWHVIDGELDLSNCFVGDSYAHVFGEEIVRYSETIGKVEDLREGWIDE